MSESPKPRLYWSEDIQSVVVDAIAELIRDPNQRAPFWIPISQDLAECRSLPELLQMFNQYGYHLDEFKVVQTLLNKCSEYNY